MTVEQAKAIMASVDLSSALTQQEQATVKQAMQVLAGGSLRPL